MGVACPEKQAQLAAVSASTFNPSEIANGRLKITKLGFLNFLGFARVNKTLESLE